MVIRTKTCNVLTVERIKEALDKTGLQIIVKVMRLPDRKFAVALFGDDVGKINAGIFAGIPCISIDRNDSFFTKNERSFQDYQQFLEEFDRRSEKVSA
jgi:hypothetical protein